MIPGDPIPPATRRTLTVTIAAASGDVSEAGLSLARARLDVLAPNGVATAGLLAFVARVQALLDPRCPRCLDASLGLCSPCRRAHVAEAELAGRVRANLAPPADLLALTARLDAGEPAPVAPMAVGTEPGIAPTATGMVLDQIDRDELARACAGKAVYPSEVDAKRTARACEAKRGTPLRAYLCWPGCGGWHLTKLLEVPAHVRERGR